MICITNHDRYLFLELLPIAYFYRSLQPMKIQFSHFFSAQLQARNLHTFSMKETSGATLSGQASSSICVGCSPSFVHGFYASVRLLMSAWE